MRFYQVEMLDPSRRYLRALRPDLDVLPGQRTPNAPPPPVSAPVAPSKAPEPIFVAANWAVAGGVAGGVLGLIAGGLSGFGWGKGAGVGLAIGALGGGAAGLVSSVALTKAIPT